ncbi:Importin subunit alpha-2, partial [Bienertia sinuspersici]
MYMLCGQGNLHEIKGHASFTREGEDEELATEVAWVVVYLTALSNSASGQMVKSNLVHLLVERLATSNSLQLLIPVLRGLGNLVAGDANVASVILAPGNDVTDKVVAALVKCLGSEHRVLKKGLDGFLRLVVFKTLQI